MPLRRTTPVALTVLAAVSTALAPAAAARAAAPEVLTCSVNASVAFAPPLSAAGPATTVTIGGTASGCSDSRTGQSAVVGGTVTATLAFGALSCNPLIPATLKPGASAYFTWNLKDGSQTTSTVGALALTEVDGVGTLTGTVTPTSPRLAGEHLTTILNITSVQPLTDNCIDVLAGTGAPISNSTLAGQISFG
ncbi:hypothetical protein [Kitasatospora purpeofusca]|uniref:hypothetical protein n=1 Tax=Kitasatospora purpeofusca TaxID=67352 RepID=UPI00365442A0